MWKMWRTQVLQRLLPYFLVCIRSKFKQDHNIYTVRCYIDVVILCKNIKNY